ncbi:oxidoreductase, short chain dehydrogenase reductase family [Trichoderma arundinaceum]|uniref:Oxidoreductase, short chain dehydrogenase reductase family n=1 Tax=Trichoderma arundinaceum TaxID=490622 RepID=A0A395NJ33_TRIAR|nr:oxidoreductase, short chain dehydrogenase reductase family [Trichoderma arundinaceum]
MNNTDNLAIPKWVSFTNQWHTKPYPDISPSRNDLSAIGKNVVITGGGTGIGKAIAIAFAQAGANSVAILGRRLDRLKSSAIAISAATQSNTQIIYRRADLADRAQVEDALAGITSAVGEVDIFVNNAGSLPPLERVARYDAATFMRAFEMNVLTSLNAIQAFIPVAGLNPILLNVSTNLAHIQPMPGMPAYAASKTAQLKMVEHFAVENPELHVVSFQPGVIATEIAGPNSNIQGQDEVELPAHFCVWLASAEAKFLKGKFVWANWDVPELLRRAEEIRDSRLLTVGLAGVAILQVNTSYAATPPTTASAPFPASTTDMGEMRAQKNLGRRKACDACCRRKIRCDANVPKCSACILHSTLCTWTPGLNVKAPVRKMKDVWYRFPHERNEASWASINVVLALSLQQTPLAATTSDDQVSSECIKNAQSVLNHLVIRDEDLQGLQVILALVILFLGTSRPQPSCVLIGTAVRLAHRLKLHLQEGLNDANSELAAQKERLLWITYILDRDISMRTVEPYGLQDYDMEIDTISATLKDDPAGVLSLPGSPYQTANIFHLRIQLARIQGQMYDLTYSVRARKFSGDQQESAAEQLMHLLEGWRNAVPEGFRIEDLPTCASDNVLNSQFKLDRAPYGFL